MKDFYFFTDVDLLNSQPSSYAFGSKSATEYLVSSLHTASASSNAYAVASGQILNCPVMNNGSVSNLVNAVIKPDLNGQAAISIPRINYQFTWKFGDGQTSTLESPTYTYQDTGSYTVSLVAMSTLNGCRDSIERPNIIQLNIINNTHEHSSLGHFNIFVHNQNLTIIKNNTDQTPYALTLYDISGKKLYHLNTLYQRVSLDFLDFQLKFLFWKSQTKLIITTNEW